MPGYLHVDPGAFNIEACSQSLRFEEKNKKISLLVQEFDIYGTHHQMNGENAPPPNYKSISIRGICRLPNLKRALNWDKIF